MFGVLKVKRLCLAIITLLLASLVLEVPPLLRVPTAYAQRSTTKSQISGDSAPGAYYGAWNLLTMREPWLLPGHGFAAGMVALSNLTNLYIEAGVLKDCRSQGPCTFTPYASWQDNYGNPPDQRIVWWDPLSRDEWVEFRVRRDESLGSTIWKTEYKRASWSVWSTIVSVDMGISAPFPYTGAGGEGYCSNADCPDYSLIGPFGQVSTWYNKYWDGSRNPQGEEIWNPWCYAEPIYSNVDGNYSACDPQSGYWNWLVRYDPRIFLPYVEQGGGTSTHVAVQNPGSFATIVDVKLFDLSGNQVASASRNLLSGGSYLFDFPGISLPDGKGYAVVRGNNRNLTVLGKIQNPFRASGYTGTVGEDGTATSILGLGYADTRLYVPLVKKYWYGHTGAIHVLNVGRGSTFVQLDFKAESSGTGSDCTYADPTALGPGQSRTYDLHSDILPAGCLVNGRWLGAATITAVSSGPSYQEPLVVVAADLGDAGTADQNHAMRYNAFRVGAWEAYVPLVKKAWYGGSTGIMVMNVGNAVAYVLVDFYACYAGDCTNQYTVPDPNTPALIEPGRGKSFYAPPGVPDGFLGSAKVRSTNQQTVVAMANDIYASKKTNESTSAFLPGWTQSVHLPLNFRQGSHMGWTQWEGGIQVQNTGTGYLTQLSVEYFDQNGNLVLSRNLNDAYPPNLGSLAPNRSVNYYAPPIPSQYLPFQGAVKISANGPVVAISNLTATDASTTVDASVGYNGYPR